MRHAGVSSKKSALLAWMEKISAGQAKIVVAVSANCKQELETLYGISPEKMIVLNNFVDEHMFYPLETPKTDKIKILFSGRLEERKGLSALLELAMAIESTDQYQLRIAVNSNDNCRLFEGFKNTSISTHLDINGMREFYNTGDVFYFPTKYEGFSMTTLEALACGVPVIGSGFAIPQELRHYEFVRIEESADVKNVLAQIGDIQRRFGNSRPDIHRQIMNDFGYEQYSQKLLHIIEERSC
jgi:glycosyltransferase involved in cell wall biosynthesis